MKKMLFLALMFSAWVWGQVPSPSKMDGQSSTGEKFVYFAFATESSTEDWSDIILTGGEKFPSATSQAFETLAKKILQHGFQAKLQNETTVRIVEVATPLKDGRMRTFDGVIKAIGGHFRQPMAEFSPSPKESKVYVKGPWEIYPPWDSPGSSPTDWSAQTSVLYSPTSAHIMIEERSNGKVLMGLISQNRLRQEFEVKMSAGKPTLSMIRWVIPGPCGSSTPSKNKENLWGKHYQKYVGDLPQPLRAYLEDGAVNAEIERQKNRPSPATAGGCQN